MTALTWDTDGSRLYTNGVDHGIIAPHTGATQQNGRYQAYAWNGLTEVNIAPDGGDISEIYADNIVYATLQAAETLSGTISAFWYPSQFEQCNGILHPNPDAGVHQGFELHQQSRLPFDFAYRTKIGSASAGQDYAEKIHVVYNCTVTPSEEDYTTRDDSTDLDAFSWDFTSAPQAYSISELANYKPASEIVFDSNRLTAAQMTAVRNALYGTDTATPTIPTPSQFYVLLQDAPVSSDEPEA